MWSTGISGGYMEVDISFHFADAEYAGFFVLLKGTLTHLLAMCIRKKSTILTSLLRSGRGDGGWNTECEWITLITLS